MPVAEQAQSAPIAKRGEAFTRTLDTQQHAALMQMAFDQVANPVDWRAPIDAYVPWDLANVYVQAIEFMTATRPDCERVMTGAGVMAHLSAVGYRNGPAGG